MIHAWRVPAKEKRLVYMHDVLMCTLIRDFLANPLVLKPQKPGNPLILYLAIEGNAMGAMLA